MQSLQVRYTMQILSQTV